MSERYQKLFTLPENLYAAHAPVLIAAGALLKDTQTGKVLAQLKIKNAQSKPIKAVKAAVTARDTAGKVMGEAIPCQYLDLNAARDAEFGQQVPIKLPDAATRSFDAVITEVVFADGGVWAADDQPWEPLTRPTRLDSALKDKELVKQYQLRHGHACAFAPTEEKGLWRCACGALNTAEESDCHACKQSLAAEKATLADIPALKAATDARLAKEKEAADAAKAAADAQSKKAKKLALILTPIAVVAIVAIVLISGAVKKSNAYKDAVALMEAGYYDSAISAFAALGEYRDCPEMIEQTRAAKEEAARSAQYEKALSLLDGGQYDAAAEAFTALGDYRDSADMVKKCEESKFEAIYAEALTALDNGEYQAAHDTFLSLGDYKDCAERLEKFAYVKLENTLLGKGYSVTYLYHYNERGLLSMYERIPESKDDYDYSITYEYDSNDHLISSVTKITNSGYSNDKTQSITYEYDRTGNITRSVEEYVTATSSYSAVQTYDSHQYVIKRVRTNHKVGTLDTIETTDYIYEYDAAGNIIYEEQNYTSSEKEDEISKVTYTYTYDENNRMTSMLQSGHTKPTEIAYELDENGRVIKQTTTPPNVKKGSSTIEYQYDDQGNLIKEIHSDVTYNYQYGWIYIP